MPAPLHLFLARQPILDRHQVVHGYRLTLVGGNGEPIDPDQGYAALDLAAALNEQLAFLPLGAAPLRDAALEAPTPHATVLEVEASDLLVEDLKPRLAELRQRGFRFAATGVEHAVSRLDDLAGLADYLKLDTQTTPRQAFEPLLAALHHPYWKIVATGVESPETKKWCESLGVDYLQGYYFARAQQPVDKHQLDSSATGLLKLINLLNSDAELPVLETAFKTEPALTVNLLRLVNSVGMGNRVQVTSVRHAISVLGHRQLLRWLQLLMFSSHKNGDGLERNPLMQQAALRGYFMELLADASAPGNRDLHEQAFLTGLLSLVPVALGIPLPMLLEKITVGDQVRDALLEGGGSLGTLLGLATAYDDGDLPRVASLLAGHHPLDLTTVSRCLVQGLAWLRELTAETAG